MATFPSGDTPTHVMFFVVDMGNVSDVLLMMEEKTPKSFYSQKRKNILHQKASR